MSNTVTERNRVKRLHERGHYDEATIHAILDVQPFCTVGYVFGGAPYVTPSLQWREGNHIYWHGSSASRMLETCQDAQVCVNVTIYDGMVMARSAFHHSVNYRSVMAFGRAFKVTDAVEKVAKLKTFVDKLYPGRWDILRPVMAKEAKATMMLGLELSEVSAKIRSGPPKDDDEDYALPIWAGVIPLRMQTLPAIDDPKLMAGVVAPEHVRTFKVG